MANDISQRVRYAEGQRIGAADLESEQLYLLGLDARHNLGQHVPGVALGLVAGDDGSGDRVVTAGIAIDSQGRELQSAADAPVPGDPAAKCVDLWIVYCLVPLRVRQTGRYDCSPDAFQRWREFGQIVSSAGDAGTGPVPPFDGAVYLGRINCASSPDIDTVALMGQSVADPGERTFLQVGPANERDRNGFMLSASDSSGVVTPRLAIDRLGTTTFWGDIILLGPFASASLPVPEAEAILMVQAKNPGAAGEQLRARLAPSATGAGAGALDLTLLIAGKRVTTPLSLGGSFDEIQAQLQLFNKTSGLANLTLVRQDPDHDQDTDVQSPASQTLTGQDTALTPTGGSLKLENWPDMPAQPAVAPRGCATAAPGDPASLPPDGISFTPPAQPAKGTPLPGASAARIVSNGNPTVQLRLDLGKKKDNDPTIRLAMGAPVSHGDFAPWLTADGNGNLAVIGAGTALTPSMSLNVTGTISQAPIQADPTDSRFTNLLVLFWLKGLESAVQASTVVQLAVTNLPALIETGQPWSYTVTATNAGSVAVVADKLFETRSIGGQTLLTNVSNQTTIPPGGNSVFTVTHQAGDMGTTGSLSIEVRMSGKIGNFPWWKAKTAGPIPVVQSPAIDISDLPGSAPPGADFSYSFTIANPAPVGIHLTAVALTEGASAPRQLPIAVAGLQQGDQEVFGPILHPGGISMDLAVGISIGFTWNNGPASSVTAHKTITCSPDLDVQFQNIPASVHVALAWTYDLLLTNTGSNLVTVQSLEQGLSSADFADTPYANIPIGGPIALHPGQSRTVPNIAGTLVPSATTKIVIEIRSTYQREGRTWIPETATQDVNVT